MIEQAAEALAVLAAVLGGDRARREGDGAVGRVPSVDALSLCLAELCASRLAARVRGEGDRVVRPPPGGALLDLGELSRVLSWEPVSLVARVEAGARVADVEREARERGFTLGPLPPSALRGSVGAWLAGPTAGARAVPGGRLETAALSVTSVGPDGTVYRSVESPRSATGPDLDHLALGGGGRLLVIASAALRLFPRPAAPAALRRWRRPSLGEAAEALERLLREGAEPAGARLSWGTGGAALDAAFVGVRGERMVGLAASVLGAPEDDPGLAAWWAAREALRNSAAAPPLEAWSPWCSLAAVLSAAGGEAGAAELHLVHQGGALAVIEVGDVMAAAMAARKAGARTLAPAGARPVAPPWASAGGAATGAFRRLAAILDPAGILGGAP